MAHPASHVTPLYWFSFLDCKPQRTELRLLFSLLTSSLLFVDSRHRQPDSRLELKVAIETLVTQKPAEKMETIKRWFSKFIGCVELETLEKQQSDFQLQTLEKQQSDDQLETLEEQQSDDQLETLEEQQLDDQSETLEEQQLYDQLETLEVQQSEISFPIEIIEEIVCRLPVKSILRFRSISKPWLSLISNPSFTKLQLTQATVSHRTAFFIIADDASIGKRHILSAQDGGSVTHFLTIKLPVWFRVDTEAEHLNGLVSSFTGIGHFFCKKDFVVNLSTLKFFQLPNFTSMIGVETVRYFFGFDESRNEHKILSIIVVQSNSTRQMKIMIFSMSNYSWRKIDDTGLNSLSHMITKTSVCVNSIIYLLIVSTLENVTCESEILAFDLTTEKFSIIKFPPDGVQHVTRHFRRDEGKYDPIYPYLIKVNGCIGVVCHHHVVKTNQMHIWILQDYENHVWLRKTITFHEAWIALGCPFPMDFVNRDEVIFFLNKLSRNVISAPIYNIKSGCFRSVQFTFSHPFLCSETVEFSQIKCYVESMMPL